MRIRRLPRAIRDVDGIWDYVAREDPIAADRLVDRIVAATGRLADFPKSGTARSVLGDGVRSIPVGRYLVLYRVATDCVEIVRVLHGAQEIERILEGD